MCMHEIVCTVFVRKLVYEASIISCSIGRRWLYNKQKVADSFGRINLLNRVGLQVLIRTVFVDKFTTGLASKVPVTNEGHLPR